MWTAFKALLLAAHLLAINVAAAGPLAWAWLLARGNDERRLAAAQRAARQSLAGLLLGIALGAALLVAPTPGLSAALRRFPASAYWFGAAELAFSAAVIICIIVAGRRCQGRPWLAWLTAIVTASNLLYHFPPWMAVIGRLAAESGWAIDDVIPRTALVRLSLRGEILSLWIHFVLASVAVAAIAAMWPRRGEEADVSAGGPWRSLGALALGATLLQLPVGLWVTATSPPAMRDALLGNDVYASAVFLGGVAAALWLMHLLASIVLGEATASARRRTGVALLAVVVLMTATLTAGRRAGARRPSIDRSTASKVTETRPAPPALH